jgi:hypothetical protein
VQDEPLKSPDGIADARHGLDELARHGLVGRLDLLLRDAQVRHADRGAVKLAGPLADGLVAAAADIVENPPHSRLKGGVGGLAGDHALLGAEAGAQVLQGGAAFRRTGIDAANHANLHALKSVRGMIIRSPAQGSIRKAVTELTC